jgi:large subunit ribosomal protein L29
MRINEVRELNSQELQQELGEQERALMNLRFRMATLQLSDSSQIRSTRRAVARIRTVMRERQIVVQYNLAARPSSTAVAEPDEEPAESDAGVAKGETGSSEEKQVEE